MACVSKRNKKVAENLSPDDKETLELTKKIKKRTERHLKKYGIKRVLLDNDGKWIFGVVGAIYTFKKNGRLIEDYKSTKRIMYWKVENRKLYIKPKSKYFLMKIGTTKDFSYTSGSTDKNKYLKKIKYVLTLKTSGKVYEGSGVPILISELTKYDRN